MIQRHIRLGNSFLNVYQLDAAEKEFEDALKLDPNNKYAQMGLFKSRIFKPIKKENYDPEVTEKRIRLIQEEDLKDPHAFLALAEVYSNIDTSMCIKYCKKAISNDSLCAHAYFKLGIIYDSRNKSNEAIKWYQKALKLSEWNQTYLNNVGYQFLTSGDYEDAINYYDLVLRMNDKYLLTFFTISKAYRLIGDLNHSWLYLYYLCQFLDDEKITNLNVNRGTWFFHTKSRPVYFFECAQKNIMDIIAWL